MNKKTLALLNKAYSILTVFMLLGSNFIPLLNGTPNYAIAQDSNTTIESPQDTELLPEVEVIEEPVVDLEVEKSPEIVPVTETPKVEIPEPVKEIVKPVKEEIKVVEVTVEDAGNGALDTVVENILYDCTPASKISCVVTDKPDYSPTGLVTLNGYGYEFNSEYLLTIYSENNPDVSHETNVTTDNKGSFEYKYQLDGNYRPQYYVDVSKVISNDTNELLSVAKGSFTDSNNNDNHNGHDHDEDNNCNDDVVNYTAKIEVKKQVEPSSDNGKFNLLIDSNKKASCIKDNGTTGKVTVSAGTNKNPGAVHTVSESTNNCSNTSLSNYFTTIKCVDRGTNKFNGHAPLTFDGVGPLNVPVNKDDDIVCTITNTVKRTNLIVKKVVIGSNESPSEFSFKVNNGNSISFENDGRNELKLAPGIYNVTENPNSKFTTTYNNCSNIDLSDSSCGVQTCTITNRIKPTTLTVIKSVKNDNGGTKVVSDFKLYANNQQVVSGVKNTVNPGTYTLREDNLAGYAASAWGNDCSANGTVTLNPGDNKTCTITNDDIQPTLTVTKLVDNQFGGTLVVSSFDLFVKDVQVISGETNGFNAGDYNVWEDEVLGYKGIIGGDCAADGSITLNVGDNKSCLITNTDIQPKLTVKKVVVNDNGGSSVVSDFDLFVNTTKVNSNEENGFLAGNYVVSEGAHNGYTSTISGDCDIEGNVNLSIGDNKICTITNDDIPGVLIVKKVVVGSDEDESNFSFSVNEGEEISFESDGQNTLEVNAGTYTVEETNAPYYTTTYDNCDEVVVSNGESETCTITNTLKPSSITVVKTVVNNNGGEKVVSDFPLYINDGEATTEVISGDKNVLPAGTYTVTEENNPEYGYSASVWGTDCSEEGVVTIVPGEDKTCTITNDDNPAILNVVKVINGTEENYSNFSFTVNEGEEINFDFDGQNDSVNNGMVGTYTVSELEDENFTTTYENCNEVIVSNGETETCTITNTYIDPSLEILKSNNANSDKKIGDVVQYTLTVNVNAGHFLTKEDNCDNRNESSTSQIQSLECGRVPSLIVTDVTPNGFKYISGSWSGFVNGTPLTPTELSQPTYASPGDWTVYKDLNPNDTVTLVYSALITDQADPGLYKDLAFAYGNTEYNYIYGNPIYALAVGESKQDTNFVGTQVNVVNPVIEEDGVVLGISTIELPQTGINSLSILIAGIISIIGLILTAYGLGFNFMKNRGMKNILGLLVLPIFMFAFSTKADAAYILRVEEPKSATKTTFNIDYVALDTTGSTVNVKCEVVKPSSASVVFSNTNTISGGNSGKCDVTMAELSEGDGVYTFNVKANDDLNTLKTFAVTFDTVKPGIPVSFDKSETSCGYKIDFKTASDAGQTTKVEVFRSTLKAFNADSSTLVETVLIGSNTNGTFSNTKPNCNKTYFYAIRSIDAAGNVSDFIGDTITETKVVLVEGNTTNNGTTENTDNNGEVAGENTGKPGKNDGKGEVEGTDTSNENKDNETPKPEDNTKSNGNTAYWLGGGFAFLGGLFLLSKYGILQAWIQKIVTLVRR